MSYADFEIFLIHAIYELLVILKGLIFSKSHLNNARILISKICLLRNFWKMNGTFHQSSGCNAELKKRPRNVVDHTRGRFLLFVLD